MIVDNLSQLLRTKNNKYERNKLLEQWREEYPTTEIIKNNTGSNYVIKLDPQSLPEGMRVISENPKAKLVSMYGLNEINFEVQYIGDKKKDEKKEEKDK